MMLKLLVQKKWTFILLLLIPLMFVLTSYWATDQQPDHIKVPVVLVDEFNQDITQELISDMTTDESFNVMLKNTIPKHLINRGQVEAIFVLPNHLKELIESGDLKESIKWYRHERSLFDGLFKEQLASAIMTRAVRAESANIVHNYDQQPNWDDMYEFGLRYIEPEPIFQIQFETIQQQGQLDQESGDSLLYRWLFWIFIWVMLAPLAQLLLSWKNANIMERMKTIGHSSTLNYLWFVTVLIVLLILTVCVSLGVQLIVGQLKWAPLFVDVGMVLTSVILYFITAIIVHKKESLWLFTISYGATASAIFYLVYFNFLTMNDWLTVFLPVWILLY
jgi:ABC-2 family transporter protein